MRPYVVVDETKNETTTTKNHYIMVIARVSDCPFGVSGVLVIRAAATTTTTTTTHTYTHTHASARARLVRVSARYRLAPLFARHAPSPASVFPLRCRS